MSQRASRLCAGWALVAWLLGAYWRLVHVETALLFGDEFHSLRVALADYRAVLTVFEPNGSGMALPLLQRLSSTVWGENLWALRAPAWLPSLLTLALIYPLGRRLVGPTAAAIAAWLVAANSFLIFYAHFGRAYSLVSLLALLLLFLSYRTVEEDKLPATRWWAIAATTGLLPWVHLSSLAFVAPVLGATVLAVWSGTRPHATILRLSSATLAGAVLLLLLHLPAWNSLWRFLSSKLETQYAGSFGLADIGALLVGSRIGAALIAVIILASVLAYANRRRRFASPLLAAVFGPPLILGILQPFGDAYAYARYLTASLPAAMLLAGWGIAALCARFAATDRSGRPFALALGLGVAGFVWVLGPIGPGRMDDGPHANTYMQLHRLPAFDLAWEAAPPFYHTLASNPEPVRILEVPALTTRARHLYRNYYRLHGKPTALGLLPSELWDAPQGPYVSLRDPQLPGPEVADYLILHHDVDEELARYWNFVYRENPGLSQQSSVRAFMNRHRRLQRSTDSLPGELRFRLQQELGFPVYSDDEITVWALRP